MLAYLKSKNILLDVIFITVIALLSFLLISFYLPAQNLNITYPDWMVQAFRIKMLELHGATSWTHTWSNGIDMWRSYQFIPHFITLGISNYFALDIPRAMVVIVMAQFILLRFVVYLVARLLKFSPFTALFASLATFSIAYFWKAVGDYSLLFSLTFFPIMIYLWVKYMEGKIHGLYPYIAGLMFYVHPLLGVTSIGMWAIAQFFIGAQIFSRKTFIQFFLFLLASSFFWVPLILKQSYTNSTVYLATKEFLQLSLAPFPYFGLSLILLIFFFIGFSLQFFPGKKQYRWTKVLFLFVALFLGLIYIGTQLSLPSFINQFQYTRGVGLIGIGIVFCILPLVETIQKFKSLFIKGLLVATLTVTVVEGVWVTSLYSPDGSNLTVDPVTTFFTNKNIRPEENRVWTSTIELTSYYGSDTALRMPTSYMAHLESNHLPERMNQLITYRPFLTEIPVSEVARINDYFMLTGVKYVFLEESSPFVDTFANPASEYKKLGQVVVPSGIFEVFETPWAVRNAVLISNEAKSGLQNFPHDIRFDQAADQISLDNKVKAFTKIIYDPINLPLEITYPTQESIMIDIPQNSTSNYVFVNESYSKQWKAYLNDQEQSIEPIGPNFMLVTISNAEDGGTLILKHTWPDYYYYLLFALPIIPFWLWIGSLIFNSRKTPPTAKKTVKTSRLVKRQTQEEPFEFVNLLHKGGTT